MIIGKRGGLTNVIRKATTRCSALFWAMRGLKVLRTILTAPAGAGKTEAAINAILRAEREGFAQEVWVLLPTTLQIEAFRERLLNAANLGAIFNIRFFSFYELYDHLL